MGGKRIVEFDIDRYLRNSKKLDLSHLDWEDIPNHPLTDGDVMCMHYMMDIETHTVSWDEDDASGPSGGGVSSAASQAG